jgi:hypothetical protein
MSENTLQCPAKPTYGHQWETVAGNGISSNESLVGKLWQTKTGKVIVVFIGIILFLLFSK